MHCVRVMSIFTDTPEHARNLPRGTLHFASDRNIRFGIGNPCTVSMQSRSEIQKRLSRSAFWGCNRQVSGPSESCIHAITQCPVNELKSLDIRHFRRSPVATHVLLFRATRP